VPRSGDAGIMFERDGALIILSHNPDQEIAFTLEALTQAAIIFSLGVAIVVSNVLIIASLLTAHGEFKPSFLFIFYCICVSIIRHIL
jgi:hypothetical protein